MRRRKIGEHEAEEQKKVAAAVTTVEEEEEEVVDGTQQTTIGVQRFKDEFKVQTKRHVKFKRNGVH